MWPFGKAGPSSSGQGGDLATPRPSTASAADAETNPFEQALQHQHGPTSNTSSALNSKAPTPQGARTPTQQRNSVSLLNPAASSNGQPPATPQTAIPGHVLPPTPGGGITPGGLPTTSITMNEPDFSFKTQPAALGKSRRENASAPKGKLSLRLHSARGLSSPSENSRPYAVVTFDQNEFVSREALDEDEEHALGLRDSTGSNGAPAREPEPPADAMVEDEKAGMAYNPVWKHEVFFDVMNEMNVAQVVVYDRAGVEEEEAFLGTCEIRPRLVNGLLTDQWFTLKARAEGEIVSGAVRIQLRYEKFDIKKGLSVNDFDFLRMIGKGTFGRVFQVRKKDTRRIYAMKVLSKREIVAKKEVAHTIGERKILQRSSENPFLLGLKFSFQSEIDLYLVMDYKSGGELFHHLQREGRFTEDRARFYTAEIVLAFEHLHKFDIVYRDLKPENILLDATGHIVLCDFGLSKPDLPSDALTNTFCGTTEYLAPEVLLDDHGYSKLVDFWSLGVLLFEMCCGWSPFYAEDTQAMYKLICFGKVKFPRGVIGEDGKHFVKCLLNRNPKHRLGATRDAEELKEHPFFKTIDWVALAARQVPPPFKPTVESDESVANFDPEFTEANLLEEAPEDVVFDDDDPSADWLKHASARNGSGWNPDSKPVEIKKRPPPKTTSTPLTSSVQENFRGFTFSGEGESFIPRPSSVHRPNPLFSMTSMSNDKA